MSYMLNFQNKIDINCVVTQLQLPDEIRSGKDRNILLYKHEYFLTRRSTIQHNRSSTHEKLSMAKLVPHTELEMCCDNGTYVDKR